jgi:RAD51-like protein 2
MWLTHQEQILLTSTLATKLVNADGTLGNFDTGASAVMVPALGPSLRISY